MIYINGINYCWEVGDGRAYATPISAKVIALNILCSSFSCIEKESEERESVCGLQVHQVSLFASYTH